MRRLAALALGLVAGAACVPDAGAAGRDGGAPRRSCDDTREEARAILVKYCGECHVGSRPTAKAKALRVFDLDEMDFAARMSQRQLRNAAWRLGEPLDGRARPLKVSAEERAAFQKFVDAQAERRGRSEP